MVSYDSLNQRGVGLIISKFEAFLFMFPIASKTENSCLWVFFYCFQYRVFV